MAIRNNCANDFALGPWNTDVELRKDPVHLVDAPKQLHSSVPLVIQLASLRPYSTEIQRRTNRFSSTLPPKPGDEPHRCEKHLTRALRAAAHSSF